MILYAKLTTGARKVRPYATLASSALIALALLTSGCSRTAPSGTNAPPVAEGSTIANGPVVTGRIENPHITEASGLAPSRRADGILWTHNDSGGDPAAYAISTDGKYLGSVWLAGADNVDWEDMASFTLGGRPYLLMGDVGDNSGKRKSYTLYVIEEPDPAQLSPTKELIVPIAWSISFVYPDSAHDCESVAVDVGTAPDGSDGKIYILTKRETPPRLFTLPLRPAAPLQLLPQTNAAPARTAVTGTAKTPTRPKNNAPAEPHQTAWFVAKVTHIPQPTSAQAVLPVPTGVYRACPTSMDFAPDGSAAVVLTYGDVLYFPRSPGETWATALMREPVVMTPHNLGQAEGVCFSRDGKSIFVTEENVNAPVLRYDLKQ